jgi:rRNA maturation protein Nop10
MGHIYIRGEGDIHITNIFRHTDLHIAFRTNNTIQYLLKKKIPDSDKFSSSGVYRLMCPECGKAYVGQTGRRFSLRYNEHRRAFYKNSPSSSFAQHLLDETHPFGPINDIMQVLHHQRKCPHLNTMERFDIYTEYTAGSHLNDEHTISPNKIFDSLIKPSSQQTPP